MASKIKKGKFKNSGDKLQAFPFHVRDQLRGWCVPPPRGYTPALPCTASRYHHFEFAAPPLCAVSLTPTRTAHSSFPLNRATPTALFRTPPHSQAQRQVRRVVGKLIAFEMRKLSRKAKSLDEDAAAGETEEGGSKAASTESAKVEVMASIKALKVRMRRGIDQRRWRRDGDERVCATTAHYPNRLHDSRCGSSWSS